MTLGPRVRAMVLLVLLAANAFAIPADAQTPSAPTAPQAQPFICFDHDAQRAGACTGGTVPGYLQGDKVRIDLQGAPGTTIPVSARCVLGCPAADVSASHTYWAQWSGRTLTFPDDFTEPGPQGNGANALVDKAGRYNSTWEVTAQIATGSPISRDFGVWTYDAMVSENMTVHPGETHYLRSVGFTPGGDVSYHWERRDPLSGHYQTILSRPGKASASGTNVGWFEDSFQLPPSEALNITSCGRALFDCYRIVISGAGKQAEAVPVQVDVATINRSVDTTPRPQQTPAGDVARQRSDNVSFDIDLYYPGGDLHLGPKLQTGDIPSNAIFGAQVLRVTVEKVYRNNNTVYQLDEVPGRFEPSAFVWRAQWTIPKNLTDEPGNALYRLRLTPQTDRYGNKISEDILGNFTVSAAQIMPTVATFWRELERTQQATLQLAVRYHDGEPFTPDDATPVGNTSPLHGCFVWIQTPAPSPAPTTTANTSCQPNDPLTWGVYDPTSQLWNFTVKYTRDYPNLAFHRFILVNNTPSGDRYQNTIDAITTDVYRVVPAQPAVDFTTVTRGKETDTFERGNKIFVSATITYHDGSPYDHHVRVDPNSTNATILQGQLLRRGPGPNGEGYGPLAGDDPFNLTETDPARGLWTGYLQLSDDDTNTPVGIWTFQFNVSDNVTVPNVNLTSFDREVVSSTIQLCPTFQPPGRVSTGTPIKFRFKLFYSDCDTGREVGDASVVGKLNARVFHWDPQRLVPVGPPVSNTLVPSFDKSGTADWGIEYQVPDVLYAGQYIIAVNGTDTFGNKVVSRAFSRPFTTFTDIVNRSVIAQPATSVKRGETETVIFDARPGDTNIDPTKPLPRIELDRLDTGSTACADAKIQHGCWVRERADVRVPDPTLTDHVGEFPVEIDAPVGLYRFQLTGRDATYHVITATSNNFTVEPTDVSRSFITLPAERVTKGEPFTFYLEQQAGDVIKDRIVFLDGRPILLPSPQVVPELGRTNVTWAVPFEAPAGNYTIRITGHDISGNSLVAITPPIEALSATLEGRILGQPTRTVERGTIARVQFAVAYPNGGFYAQADEPHVYVHNASGIVGTARIRREGLSFAAEWQPSKDIGLGDYYFEVSPQATGGTGNEFPTLRSNTFKIVSGTITRAAVDQVGDSIERQTGTVYSVPYAADDKFVAFDLVYYGPGLSTIVDTQHPLAEITRSPLPYTVDEAGGKYVARLVTDAQTQTGTFRIAMHGEDANGNAIQSVSRQFVIRRTTIGIAFDRFPPQSAFGEGKTINISFVAKYAVGTVMDDTMGKPSVVALFNDRPITQRPDITYQDGHWFMSWTAPSTLPDGTYSFAIGGSDLHDNTIANSRTTPYLIQTDVAQSFAKTIPGPSPVLLMIAVAMLAAIMGGRRRNK